MCGSSLKQFYSSATLTFSPSLPISVFIRFTHTLSLYINEYIFFSTSLSSSLLLLSLCYTLLSPSLPIYLSIYLSVSLSFSLTLLHTLSLSSFSSFFPSLSLFVSFTHAGEFDRVHYPLPLIFENPQAPNLASWRRTINRLRKQIKNGPEKVPGVISEIDPSLSMGEKERYVL